MTKTTEPKEPKMQPEEMAYMRAGMAMTKAQRIHWNTMLAEMWWHSDYLLDRARFHGDSDRAKRLKDLIGQLPTFDLDGKGFSRTGNAIEDF